MKTAEEWNEEYQKLGSTRDMVEWIRTIQLDAWKYGMEIAAGMLHVQQTVMNEPNLGVARQRILTARDKTETI